ncbi:fibronectin type III domain-containing protein [Marmoricola sp. URHB0036]|uniref:fibronectin type III domain-containing protein n=1 Tax=Marmoricola sp. URHB0036 TaxID=1298863 RepID=UPI000414E72A|nr:fibronectin type III domain-containing protein [Marmoricola sp. URHB0036]
MRRTLAAAGVTLGMLSAALLTPAHGGSSAAAADIAPLPAVQADSLVDAYGVGIHLPFLDTPYRDATAVANALGDLGVRHVRDDLRTNDAREYAGIKTVADKGIKFNLIMGNPSSTDSAAAYVDTVANLLPAGSVESLEGSNECDLSGDPLWPVNLLTRQRELYQAAKANPATAALPVLSPALAFKWNYVPAGDLSMYADYANGHMYPGGYKPSNEVSQITSAIRGSIPTTKPLVTTEAGYHNALNTTNGHLPVPEDVAGVYTPRVLLEHYLRGEKRVYTYELLDEFDDPGLTDPEAHFGLLHRDFTPKPAYTAMKNLLGLLSDPGPAFTPQALPIQVTGFPGDGKYIVTQKRNGQYVVLMWRDIQIYDPVTKQPTPVTPTSTTVQLGKTSSVQVYRPSEQSGPVSQTQAASFPIQLDGSVTAITIDKLPAPAPTSVTATAGNAAATLAWQLPTTDADITGFEVTRQPGAVTTTVGPTARSYAATALTNGTSYTFSVKTLSPDGSSAAVPAPAVVPKAPVTVPSAPTITATTPGSGSITVTWTAPATGGSAITGYQLLNGTKTLSVGPTVRKATLTGLPKNTKTRVVVRAKNAVGWSAYAYSPYVTTKK